MTLIADVPRDGYLVLTTNFHPEWRIILDTEKESREISPLLANYSLMAVPVEKGHHSIRFMFRPEGQAIGLLISALTWVCLLLLSLAYGVRQLTKPARIVKIPVNK